MSAISFISRRVGTPTPLCCPPFLSTKSLAENVSYKALLVAALYFYFRMLVQLYGSVLRLL